MPRFSRHRRRRARRRRRMPRRRTRRRRIVFDPERKQVNLQENFNPALVPNYIHLNTIASGTTDQQRLGNRCIIASVQAKMTLTKNANLAQAGQLIRYMLVVDRFPDNAQPTADGSDLLAFPGVPIESPRALNNSFRFKVLMDRIVNLTIATPKRYIKWFKPLHLNSIWDGPAGAIIDSTKGALWLVFWSDTDAGGNVPTVELITRLRFVG